MQAETRFLKNRLTTLEKCLDNARHSCLVEMNSALAENIFENYDHVVQLAIDEAGPQVQRWHAPVNRVSLYFSLSIIFTDADIGQPSARWLLLGHV